MSWRETPPSWLSLCREGKDAKPVGVGVCDGVSQGVRGPRGSSRHFATVIGEEMGCVLGCPGAAVSVG